MIRALRSLLPVLLSLAIAGCASGLSGPSAGSPEGAGANGDESPARARVRPGFAEMVLTDRVWPTFAQATANRVTAIADGMTLLAHIRAARTLGDIALPPARWPRGAYEAMPRLLLQVGNVGSLHDATCYVTMSPDETGRSELVVPIAPAGIRPGALAADCFLAIAASTPGGVTRLEVRLAGFAGRVDGWLPEADLLSVSTVAADFSRGTARYEALLEDSQRRAAAARTSSGATPAAGPSAPPGSRSSSDRGQVPPHP